MHQKTPNDQDHHCFIKLLKMFLVPNLQLEKLGDTKRKPTGIGFDTSPQSGHLIAFFVFARKRTSC